MLSDDISEGQYSWPRLVRGSLLENLWFRVLQLAR